MLWFLVVGEGVLSVVADAYALACPEARDPRRGVWFMGRVWYDRVRAALVPEWQERDRAAAHARLLVAADSEPVECPACRLSVEGGAGLLRHVADFMDPGWREPSSVDRLLGLPVVVDEDPASVRRPVLVVADA